MIAENDVKKKLANVAKSITEGVTKNNIIQEEHDKRLIYYTFGGTFLNFILKTLQREEILSQLIDDQVLANVVSYSSKKMVKAKLGLITT
jgi:hypothetical protein